MPAAGTKARLVSDLIRRAIQSGRFLPGQKMPSEQALAKEFKVNHQTVRQGLARLAEDGWIIKRPRVGNFVRESPINPTARTEVALVLPSYIYHETHVSPAVDLVLQGMHDALNSDAYAITTLRYQSNQFWDQAGKVIEARDIKSVLLWPHKNIPAEALIRLLDKGVHIVMLKPEEQLEALHLPTFYIDSSAPLSQILEGAVERGHQHVMVARYSSQPMKYRWACDAAIQKACERHPVLGDPSKLVLPVPNDEDVAHFEVLDQLFEFTPRPTLVVLPDGVIASDFLRRCYQRKLWVPHDLSLALSYNEMPDVHPLPLTSPNTPARIHQLARQAASHLHDLLAGATPQPIEMRFRDDVCWTESVADLEHPAVSCTVPSHPISRRRLVNL